MSHLDFYNECKKLGIDTLASESQRRRAILVAQKHNIDECNIASVIAQQRDIIDRQIQREREQEQKELRKEKEQRRKEKYQSDAQEQQKMKIAYPFYGQEKRISHWKEKIDECRKIIAHLDMEIQQLEVAKNKTINSKFIEPKIDWAIAGGIGSAIGGAGAGVMAALEAQAQNVKIEQENEERTKRVMAAVTVRIQLQQIKERQKNEQIQILNDCQKKIEEIELKLIDEIDDPLELLNIRRVIVTPTNFSAQLSLKEKAVIFGDVEAVLDGAIWAHIYQEKKYVGSVRVVFPYEGVGTSSATVCVDTSLGVDETKKCYVEYEAETLWLIEK